MEETQAQKMPLLDQLIHSTVRLTYEIDRHTYEIENPGSELPKDGIPMGFATGFFCLFGGGYPVIVTNKHVIKDAVGVIEFTQTFHDDQNRPVYGETKTLKQHRKWCLGHPDKEVDLAIILEPKEGFLKRMRAGAPKFWADAAYMKGLSAVEEILMVGYPWGLSDEVHNLPIVRRGITATAPYIDYEDRPEFLIDCACFPGSSGSPVFLHSLSTYFDKESSKYILLPKLRFNLLGVLSQAYGGKKAPPKDKKAPSKDKKAPPKDKEAPLEFYNLGVVIKAAQLKAFDEKIDQLGHMTPADQDKELEKLFEERIAHWKPPARSAHWKSP